ncbi:hypothetical protein BWI97_14925 [Siphonobacter sp. BAB-5405]|uniref:DUF7674 family protein n=1 Tax=Siphonobacter sp. BAB-5405 TaxID=1864825 RepID=UPI000C7FFB61|nr:hypothetical protein [Siphonobacter sp. BAB-5405]PMD95634.1 hypothetical protein BWI97_14925 [Siphonobacter sp. BAB-5405]
MEIRNADLVPLVRTRVPEAQGDLARISPELGPCKVMALLSELTHRFADHHDFIAVKHCFVAADELLADGSHQIRNAVCANYVYSLASLLDRHDESAEVLIHLMPLQLRSEYIRQISNSLP